MAKKIKLTKGKFAIVDDEDFERVNQYKWYYSSGGYAAKGSYIGGKKGVVFMHRFINSTPFDKFTDHINGDKLDNRKSNLRTCTSAENMRNRKKSKNAKSEYKGVFFFGNKKGNKYWQARVRIKQKGEESTIANKYFPFTDEGKLQAARWYNEMALKHFGEFAKLNEV